MVAACPMPARRGTPLRVERLAQALAARGHAVELMTYHLAEEDGAYAFPIRRIYDRVERGNAAAGADRRQARSATIRPWRGWYDGDCARPRSTSSTRITTRGFSPRPMAATAPSVPLIYDAHTMLSAELPSYGAEWSQRLVRERGPQLDRTAAAARRPHDRGDRGHPPAAEPGIRLRSGEASPS